MKSTEIEKKIFYNANPLSFQRAKELRNSLTKAEKTLWAYLKTKPLGYKFKRQHETGIYITDFFCFKLNLVIEIYGSVRNKEEVKKNNEELEKLLRSGGPRIIRFTNDEVIQEFEYVMIKIQVYCMLQYDLFKKGVLNLPFRKLRDIA